MENAYVGLENGYVGVENGYVGLENGNVGLSNDIFKLANDNFELSNGNVELSKDIFELENGDALRFAFLVCEQTLKEIPNSSATSCGMTKRMERMEMAYVFAFLVFEQTEIASPVRYRSCPISSATSCGMTKRMGKLKMTAVLLELFGVLLGAFGGFVVETDGFAGW